MQGRLALFEPSENLAHVQVPPSRTTLALRFHLFRSMLLTRPILPLAPSRRADPHADMLAHSSSTEFKVRLVGADSSKA